MHSIALISDLLFLAKIRTVAEAQGATVTVVKDAQSLEDALKGTPTDKLFVDLQFRKGDPLDILHTVQSSVALPSIIAYCSHTDTETIQRARTQGFPSLQVFARSAFIEKLSTFFSTP